MKTTLIILLALTIILPSSLNAQFTTKASGGNWNSGTTWIGNTAPNNWANSTASVNANVNVPTREIRGFNSITVNNGATLSASSTPSPALTFQNINTLTIDNGSIVVNGNLEIFASTINLNNGSLTVTGTLTLNASTITTASGTTLSAGSLVTNGGTFNNNGTTNITNALTLNGGINNYGTLNVGTDIGGTGSGSSVMRNYGNINLTGDITLPSSSKFYTYPGSQAIIDGNATVSGNENMVVGTNVAPPAYSDVVIRQNLYMSGSGDVTINRNGRFAVFGDIVGAPNGGTLLTVNNGGQVYVDGDITFSGGGDRVNNNNATNPYGLYVKGDITNSGGGSFTTPNRGDEMTMYNTNLPFYNWVNSFQSVLPVTLTTFSAHYNGGTVDLVWATASETNFDRFIIERSSDGRNFTVVGEQRGAGGYSKRKINYSFEDAFPLTGKSYYRLKIVDLDESFEYSKLVVVSIELSSVKGVSVYPNPIVNYQFTVAFNDQIQTPATLRIINSLGMVVMTQSLNGMESEIQLSDSLTKGVYFVKINSSNSQETVRVVIP